MAKLQQYEKDLLGKVIAVAGNDETKIRDGIVEALKGINEKGTRNYLWGLLKTKALQKIRAARRSAERHTEQVPGIERPPFALTP